MDGIKSLWTSKTFWGGVVLVGGILAGIFGVSLTPEEQAQAPDLLTHAAESVAAVVGFFMVVYGRMKATKTIGKKQ